MENPFQRVKAFCKLHLRIINALIFREVITRYGRDNIGLLWVIGEPFLFAGGVLVMWARIRPPYEHGVQLLPFLVTGYLPLLMLRHTINHGLITVKVNINLLYHRQITILHLYIARCAMEIMGVTLASIVLLLILIPLGLVDMPKDFAMVYLGWAILAWMTFGVTVILGAICEIYEFLEKFAQLLTYVMIPVSGAFYMVAWIPYHYRDLVLRIPFVNCMEMIRRGFFGDLFNTYFSISYSVAWALGLTFVGLFLLRFVRGRLEVE